MRSHRLANRRVARSEIVPCRHPKEKVIVYFIATRGVLPFTRRTMLQRVNTPGRTSGPLETNGAPPANNQRLPSALHQRNRRNEQPRPYD